VPGNANVLKGEPAQLVKNSRGEVATMRTVETGAEMLMADNIRVQQGDPEKDNTDIAIGTPTPNRKPRAAPANEELAGVRPVTSGPGSTASPMLPSHTVGRNMTLPYGQLLPRCGMCNCSALIVRTRRPHSKHNCFVCLDHGLSETSNTRDLVLRSGPKSRYAFISPEHEAAIRAFFA
jgi:hypothetical protein